MGSRGRLFIALAMLAVGLPGLARGAGGRTIADAPVIPLGQEQVNALSGIDFWRVPLRSGDQLTLRYGPQQSLHWVEICVFAPGVTDATVGNQPCYAKKSAFDSDTFKLTARAAGNWIVAVVPYPGCDTTGNGVDTRCTVGLQYSITAWVKHPTTLSVDAPNAVRRGSYLTLTGRLGGGAKGSLVFERSWDGGAHWITLGLKRPGAGGRYSFRFRVKSAGMLSLRVSYPEAPSFVGAQATTTVRIV